MGIFGSEMTENLIAKLRRDGDHKEADRILLEHRGPSYSHSEPIPPSETAFAKIENRLKALEAKLDQILELMTEKNK